MKDKEDFELLFNSEVLDMANVLCEHCLFCIGEDDCPYEKYDRCECYETRLREARFLYKSGYRKLPYYNPKSETFVITKEMFYRMQEVLKNEKEVCNDKQ